MLLSIYFHTTIDLVLVKDITQPALDAIGMVGWTPEKTQPKKKPFVLPPQPVVEVVEEPQSPREVMPHRSAGYGDAHQKRKLSVPDRSRSPSVSSRGASPTPEFDRYATKYHRKGKYHPLQCDYVREKTVKNASPGEIRKSLVITTSESEKDSGYDDDLPLPPTSSTFVPAYPSPHQQFQTEVIDFDRSKLKKVQAQNRYSEETLHDLFIAEIREFDRSKLRHSNQVRNSYYRDLTPRELLLKDIRLFDRSFLKSVKTQIKSPLPNTDVLDELFITIPEKQNGINDREYQTDQYDDSLKATATDIFSEPDSGIFSDDEYEWALVEEKVTLIRIEETEYYLEEGDEEWDRYK